MGKRLIGLLLSAVLCCQYTAVFAADSVKVYLNETFDEYALNEPMDDADKKVMVSSGLDGRTVSRNGLDKALYCKAWVLNAGMQTELNIKEQTLTVSADFMLDGKSTNAELFRITDSMGNKAALLLLQNGALKLGDGKLLSTYRMGDWVRADFILDFKNKYLSVYLDGQCKADKWYFQNRSISSVKTIDFEVAADANDEQTGIFLDNFRVYSGRDILPDSYFETPEANTKVTSFEETVPDSGNDIIKSISFESAGSFLTQAGENIVELREREDNKYLAIERSQSSNNAYIDVIVTPDDSDKMLASRGYVVECDFDVKTIDGYVDCFSSKNAENQWDLVGRIDSAGNIQYAGKILGRLQLDGWHRISLVFNNSKKSIACYVDGETTGVTASFDNKFRPAVYRLGTHPNGGEIILNLDNFRIYQGIELRDDEVVSGADGNAMLDTFKSTLETPAQALKYIGKNDFAMMINNGAYIANGEKNYSDVKPYINDGYTMMPVRLVSESLGCDVQWDEKTSRITIDGDIKMDVGSKQLIVKGKSYEMSVAPEIKGESAFLPLRDLCEKALGKQVYWDGRGFVVVSQNEFTLKDSPAVVDLFEPIDILYRYLQFERPSGVEIVNTIAEKNPDHAHPRVLGTAESIERFKQNVKANEVMAEMARDVIGKADMYAGREAIPYNLTPGNPPRLIWTSREIWERVLDYSIAYIITEDNKYAGAAWRDLKEVCTNYPDWNDYNTFLDAAEMAYGLAIGYDTFYDVFTDEQKKILREGAIRCAFEPGLSAYQGTHHNGYWVKGDDNFTSVCPGGLMSLAVAMADDEDTRPYCEILLGQTLQSYEYVMCLLYPDGAWYEGVGYLVYTTEYMYAGLGSLINATGTDYGILEAPGVDKMSDFLVGMHGLARGIFNFHDSSESFSMDGSNLWGAKVTGKKGFIDQYMKIGYSTTHTGLTLLNYDPDMFDSSAGVPLDNYYRQAEAGSMRQNWESDGIWAAVHAGQNGIDHDHLDLGEFIFEAGGIRWVDDLGSDNYDLPGYFQIEGYNLYRKRPEANNCIVINPREGYQGQSIKCTTELAEMESKERGAKMVFDLSSAYKEDAEQVMRGFLFGDDRRSFTIRDEVRGLPQNSELYWFMNLSKDIVDIQIDSDSKSAVMTANNGTKLKLEFTDNADSYEIGTMPMSPLPTSPKVDGAADDSARRKLYIRLKASDAVDISVKLIPQIGYVGDIPAVDDTAISDWVIPDGAMPARPTASSITVNGEQIKRFSEKTLTYLVQWPMDEALPEVGAVSDAQISIEQTTDESKPAVVRLTAADGTVTEYIITFKKLARIVDEVGYTPLDIAGVSASSEPEEQNKKENAIDGDPKTRWSAEGNGVWIEADLGEVKTFDAIKMAFYLGSQRTTNYDIAISADGVNYETIYSGDSSGDTDECEVYKISGTARYVRFIGHGNSEGTAWISVNEFIPMISLG